MSSNKNINILLSKKALGYYALAAISLLTGLFIRRIPFVELDHKLNIGDFVAVIIAIIGLIGAWFIIPVVIERSIQKRNSKDTILLHDLEELCRSFTTLSSQYQNYYTNRTVISEKIRGIILQDIKQISNMISDLSEAMQGEHPDLNFDKNIKAYYNEVTYKALTENLPIKKKLEKDFLVSSLNSIVVITGKIKKYRFNTFR